MQTIFPDLLQFSTHVPSIDLSFHQYLLSATQPLLVHTGNKHQAAALIPHLKIALNGRTLNYIFISHFEADECGGLSHILTHFPAAKPICSEVTARQLNGFGITNDVVIGTPGESFVTNDYELQFLAYPSEMHLWEGLLARENKRGIFFSSDLMLRFGNSGGTVVESEWSTEINNIKPEQVPDPARRTLLQDTLAQFKPRFVATGHGPCLNCK
ncbi:MAG: MBL fold metallo-hydrolase [Peptococcaceae bacterium]|nr:MBL fold metallo-hydrolase [Peptococcaceae bacterium]